MAHARFPAQYNVGLKNVSYRGTFGFLEGCVKNDVLPMSVRGNEDFCARKKNPEDDQVWDFFRNGFGHSPFPTMYLCTSSTCTIQKGKNFRR